MHSARASMARPEGCYAVGHEAITPQGAMHDQIRLICEEPVNPPPLAVGLPVVYDVSPGSEQSELERLHSLGWETISLWNL